MFKKGSRYRLVTESFLVDKNAEGIRSKDIRLIPNAKGRFDHTVSAADRLDLLAFKYYRDAVRWWQICDANSETPYPFDLLDESPIVKESLFLDSFGFFEKFNNLLASVSSIGQIVNTERSFLGSVIVVRYVNQTERQQIVTAIKSDFHLLKSFLFEEGVTASTEAFTFDDNTVKANWNAMNEELEATPGIQELQSNIVSGTILVTYNNTMLQNGRVSVIEKIEKWGFEVLPESKVSSRIGGKIAIPPNMLV